MIPLYYFAKFLFLTWLFLPNTRGALFIHDRFLSKMFGKIDLSQLKKAKDQLETGVDKMLDKISLEKEEAERKLEEEKSFAEEKERKEKIQNRLDEIKNSQGLSTTLSNELTQNTTMNNADFQQTEHNFPSPVEYVSENNKDLSLFQNSENIINRQNINNDNNTYMDSSNINKPTFDSSEQHESRQNIVSDAKICTDNLQAGFQNIQEKFSESTERLKNLKENSHLQTKPLDQKSLVSQGMEISSNMRTNMDPNFNMHDAMAEGEEVSKRIVKPITRDEKIDSAQYENQSTEALPQTKFREYNPNLAAEKKVL